MNKNKTINQIDLSVEEIEYLLDNEEELETFFEEMELF